jgi:Cd2+/Zn2+-exporting ATPase
MDLVKQLTAIGFTEYESKVYLSLLEQNPATGYSISKHAGVPRSMVYEALGRLRARGAVLETSEGKSTLYRPLPPEALLDQLFAEQKERLDILRPGLRRLFETQEDTRLWGVSGSSNVHAYARAMIQTAKTELMLVLSDQDLEGLRADIEAAGKRGIGLKVLLTGEGILEQGEVARHPPRESELQELTGSLVIVKDREEVLLAGNKPTRSGTVTNNQDLVLIARQFVWMELFAQRVYARLGSAMLKKLDPADQKILEGYLEEF